MKPPSPCIGVCKFRRAGPSGAHCIGCSMTKAQKGASKALKKRAHREAFVDLVIAQQGAMGRYAHWVEAYLRRCRKRGAKPPAALASPAARPDAPAPAGLGDARANGASPASLADA